MRKTEKYFINYCTSIVLIICLQSPNWIFGQSGCTDIWACNYDSQALFNDGSCTYPACIDEAACNFDPVATCSSNTCQYSIDNCTGSCSMDGMGFGFTGLYAPLNFFSEFGNGNASFTQSIGVLNIIGSSNDSYTGNSEVLVEVQKSGEISFDWCYHTDGAVVLDPAFVRLNDQVFTLVNTSGSNSQIGFYSLNVNEGDTLAFGIDVVVSESNPGILTIGNFIYPTLICGCIDPWACNYDENADFNDGSCSYNYGCLDSTACNFDPEADCESDCYYSIDDCANVCVNEESSGVDFLSHYEASNWNEEYFGGNGIIDHYIGALNITGATTGLSNDLTKTSIEIDFDGFILFRWNYNSQQAPFWDPGYLINGILTPLIDPEEPSVLEGEVIVNVQAGDIFSFQVGSAEQFFNPGILSITNFLYPIATCDCCLGDADHNGIVNIVDFLEISSDFGCTLNCTGDSNCDGIVNIIDLLSTSSSFGNTCESFD